MNMIPEEVFGTAGGKDATTKYKELARKVHPDICKETNAQEMFLQLQEAYKNFQDREAKNLLRDVSKGVIGEAKDILFTNGKSYYEFPITYVSEARAKKLTNEKITHPSIKVQEKISPLLPITPFVYKRGGDIIQFEVNHSPDFYPLSLVKKAYPNMEDRDKLWIMSALHNIACWFQVSDKVHLDMNDNTIFVNPINHDVAVYGGWWFVTERGSPLKEIPVATYKLLPFSIKNDKIAHSGIMTLEIKKIICDLGIDSLPKGMVSYIRDNVAEKPTDAYTKWEKDILPLYGPRKFFQDGLTKAFADRKAKSQIRL